MRRPRTIRAWAVLVWLALWQLGAMAIDQQIILVSPLRVLSRLVLLGVLRDHEQLPSVRALAKEMSVNPNTVQKAYRLLEEEGLVQSHAGAKSFVCATERQRAALRRELTENELRGMVRNMKGMGLTAKEAAALVEKLYAEEENK